MSEYKNIIGKPVKFLATDPDNAEAEGQIWYNSTSDTFKNIVALEAWSSSANTNITRGSGYGFGTLTAGVTGTGEAGPPGLVPTATEEYNGSGWATSGNYPTQVFLIKGTGTQTAGLAAGGRTPTIITNANVYNGSSWTAAGGNLNEAKSDGGMFGIQTSAIYCGGDSPTPGYIVNTELYNGSSWSEVNNLPVAKRQFGTAGTSTAGLISGGRIAPGPSVTTTENWDGTNWTSGPNINTARRYLQGWGTSTSALICGGSTNGADASALTEVYDGTSWSETADLATARHFSGTCQNQGSNTSGWAANGNAGPTYYNSTEEYNKSANVITAAAWSSGGAMPEATSSVADGGTQTAAVKGAGQKNNPDSTPTSSAEYNGTSWTAGNAVPAPYGSVTGATGTQTALITGGKGSGNTTTFEYDGTNWTTGGALGTGRYQGKHFGTQTASAYCGGRVSPPTLNNVEEYDGSSWTSVTAMPIATRNGGGYGIQTAGTVVSGFQGPSSPPVSPASSASRGVLGFDYDGTNWTTGTSSLIGGQGGGAAGTQTVAIFMAGENPSLSPSSINTSQRYDGTSYITDAALARSRATNFGITSSRTAAVGNAAAVFGGTDPAASPNDTDATEEYNVATSALNIKTITTS